jgi:hypothetical protein
MDPDGMLKGAKTRLRITQAISATSTTRRSNPPRRSPPFVLTPVRRAYLNAIGAILSGDGRPVKRGWFLPARRL